jgi:peptidoglycan L-alanyl-D-glutamate endopeptidase CwlK
MATFSKSSLEKRDTLHPKLQKIVDEAIKHVDFTILEGVRTAERQKELVEQGKSKTLNSKHLPDANGKSRAVDLSPFPIDWANTNRFYLFAGFIRGIANSLGIKIRLGADWDGDMNPRNQTFHDLPHFELESTEV